MLRIFIDPAMSSTGIFALREPGEFSFMNPRLSFKAGATLPLKFRSVKIMLSLIMEILESLYVEGEEVEFYVEQTFVGRNPSGMELSGLNFMLIDRILRSIKTKLYRGGALFMISPGMVSGKDRSAKRDRKLRKGFATEQFAELHASLENPRVFGRETLLHGAQDDVATAYLFWHYIFGPGKVKDHDSTTSPKPKKAKKLKAPVLLEIPLEYYDNTMTQGDDDGQS